MCVSCMLHTFLKYRDHYTIVAVPMQCCNYYMYMYVLSRKSYFPNHIVKLEQSDAIIHVHVHVTVQ